MRSCACRSCPRHIWSKVDDPVTFTNENPVGTGPMTEVRRFTSQIYMQCRNPHYWDAQDLKVDCLSFPQVGTNEQLLTAAAAGSIDWFGAFLRILSALMSRPIRTITATGFPPGGTVAININFDSPDADNRKAFRDLNFRRAVSMAIDRAAIVDIAGYGYPTVNDYASGLGRTFQGLVRSGGREGIRQICAVRQKRRARPPGRERLSGRQGRWLRRQSRRQPDQLHHPWRRMAGPIG
ncbi:MAG: ABC transporter substrate-binding protein [Aliidongia sp.]